MAHLCMGLALYARLSEKVSNCWHTFGILKKGRFLKFDTGKSIASKEFHLTIFLIGKEIHWLN